MLGFQNGRGGIQDQVNITAAKWQGQSESKDALNLQESIKLIMGMGWMDSPLMIPYFCFIF